MNGAYKNLSCQLKLWIICSNRLKTLDLLAQCEVQIVVEKVTVEEGNRHPNPGFGEKGGASVRGMVMKYTTKPTRVLCTQILSFIMYSFILVLFVVIASKVSSNFLYIRHIMCFWFRTHNVTHHLIA